MLELLHSALSLPNVIAFGLTFFIAFYIYCTWNFKIFKNMNIPGPNPIPLFGTWHLYLKNGFHHDLELRKKYGRTFGTFDGVNPVLVTSDRELIKQIAVKEFDSFNNHRRIFLNKALRGSVGSLKDRKWRAVRPVALSAFSAAKLKKITSLIDDSVKTVTDIMAIYARTGEMFNAHQLFKNFTMHAIARAQFATDLQSDNTFAMHANKMVYGDSGLQFQNILYLLFPSLIWFLERFDVVAAFPRESVAFFKAMIEEIILQRAGMREKPVDFLQLLLDTRKQEQVDKEDQQQENDVSLFVKSADVINEKMAKNVKKQVLTDDEIAGSSIMFLLAGFETTATTISYIMYRLAMHQDVQAKLYEEVKTFMLKSKTVTYDVVTKLQYLDQVVSEVMRMHSVAARSDRVCNKTCQVGSYTIPKGMLVQFSIHNVHYDPEYWPEPYKFDPERFAPGNRDKILPNALLPFGLGPRTCLGVRFAMLEIKVAVTRILFEYQFFRCEKTEVPLTYCKHKLIMPANGIWVAIKHRETS